MRKALIGFLMAATAATPLAAQDNGGWRGRGHDGGEQRSQRSEQRTEARQQRQQAQPQQVERQQVQQQQVQQQRVERREFRQQQAPAQVQVQGQQQQQQVRAQRNWQGGGDRQRHDNANRFAAEREASQRSAEQTIGGSFARQAAQNERRYEQQTIRREQNNGGRNNNRGGQRWGNDRGNWQGDRNGRGGWNQGWRNDNRYDWQRYRNQNRRIFNLGRYFAPYGDYGYNRLDIGIALGEAFFARNYWIDPLYYHLPPAPPGTAWVRYYDDVVLVDLYSGEVLDVINDFFE
ncbi:MAG: hypothetical protein JWO81_923 [Alphaproteobacteria bacterium]|nr:hypothetical protein [Alphaproteobacteria bacterium]